MTLYERGLDSTMKQEERFHQMLVSIFLIDCLEQGHLHTLDSNTAPCAQTLRCPRRIHHELMKPLKTQTRDLSREVGPRYSPNLAKVQLLPNSTDYDKHFLAQMASKRDLFPWTQPSPDSGHGRSSVIRSPPSFPPTPSPCPGALFGERSDLSRKRSS